MNEFLDKDLGTIIIKRNSRARRVIARRKPNMVEMTVPQRLTESQIKKHFDNLKPRILQLPVKQVVKITEESKIKTLTFEVVINRVDTDFDNASMSLKDGIVTIDFPVKHNIESDTSQEVIRKLIIHALRHEAKRVLPDKVRDFAKKMNVQVNDIKINSSKHRWGSCTGIKNINLSLFVMMLPVHLINYVIIHELVHTVELNHSPRFWALLDEIFNGKAREVDYECAYYDSDILYSMKQ